MRQVAGSLVAGAVLAMSMGAAAWGQTLENARKQAKAQDWPGVVDAVDRTFVRTDVQLNPQEQYDLLMLRGEAMLQLKRRSLAERGFLAAAQAAPSLDAAAIANANAVIVVHSSVQQGSPTTQSFSYAPRGESERIDITDEFDRKKAMEKLIAESDSSVRKEFQAALSANTLPPIENAFRDTFDLYSLQVATRQKTDDTKDMMLRTFDKAQALLANELIRVGQGVTSMERIANSYDPWGGGGRRGLSSRERAELQETATYVDRIHERLVAYRRVALRFDANPSSWDRLVADTVDLQSRIGVMQRFQN